MDSKRKKVEFERIKAVNENDIKQENISKDSYDKTTTINLSKLNVILAKTVLCSEVAVHDKHLGPCLIILCRRGLILGNSHREESIQAHIL